MHIKVTVHHLKKKTKSISRYHPRPIKYDFLRVDLSIDYCFNNAQMTPRCINGVEYTKCLRESQRSTYIKRQGKNKAASNGFKCYKKKLF